MSQDNLVKGIREIINRELDNALDIWRSKLKTEQKEREKMRVGWQEEKKKNEQLQAERDHLEDLIGEVREEAAEYKRNFKNDDELKAENERLKEILKEYRTCELCKHGQKAEFVMDEEWHKYCKECEAGAPENNWEFKENPNDR